MFLDGLSAVHAFLTIPDEFLPEENDGMSLLSSAGAGVWVLAFSAALVLAAGCRGGASYDGPPRAAVKGKVTLDGNPLPYGSISFMTSGSAGGTRNASAGIRNGEYAIAEENGPNLGVYTVSITGFGKAPPPAAQPTAEGEPAPTQENVDLGPQVVPKKYNGETQLKADIKAGPNVCDFELKSK